MTGVGARRVQTHVFAHRMRRFTALINVHTGRRAGVRSETCGTETALHRNREEFGAHQVQSAHSDRRNHVCAQLTGPLGVFTHWWAHCGAEGPEQLL